MEVLGYRLIKAWCSMCVWFNWSFPLCGSQLQHQRPPRPRCPRIYEAHVGIASPREEIASYKNFTLDVLPRVKDLGEWWNQSKHSSTCRVSKEGVCVNMKCGPLAAQQPWALVLDEVLGTRCPHRPKANLLDPTLFKSFCFRRAALLPHTLTHTVPGRHKVQVYFVVSSYVNAHSVMRQCFSLYSLYYTGV